MQIARCRIATRGTRQFNLSIRPETRPSFVYPQGAAWTAGNPQSQPFAHFIRPGQMRCPQNLEARVGFEPARAIEGTYLTHFTLRHKRPNRQTEVHGGYTGLTHCTTYSGLWEVTTAVRHSSQRQSRYFIRKASIVG